MQNKIPIFNGVEDMREWVHTLGNKRLVNLIRDLLIEFPNNHILAVVNTVRKIGMSRTHKRTLQNFAINKLEPRFRNKNWEG